MVVGVDMVVGLNTTKKLKMAITQLLGILEQF
jgi:hypothetical protein